MAKYRRVAGAGATVDRGCNLLDFQVLIVGRSGSGEGRSVASTGPGGVMLRPLAGPGRLAVGFQWSTFLS